jgi:N-acetylneuraminic acid mutarotase
MRRGTRIGGKSTRSAGTVLACCCALAFGCSQDPELQVPFAQVQFSWRQAAPCPIARFEAMGAPVGGELVVLGGFVTSQLDVTSSVQIYDPGSDSWRDAPALLGAQTHVGVARSGGDLVLAGGFVGQLTHTTSEVWLRRTTDGAFLALPALPQPRAAFGLVELSDGLHAVGGLAADGVTDSAEHTVLSGNGWTSRAPLPNPRNHLGAATLGASLYAVGGRHGWDEASGDQSSLDEYDAAGDSWLRRAAFPQPASEIAASTLATSGGRMIVVGGSVAGARPTAVVLLYDPAADAWTRLPDLPEPRKGAIAVSIGQEIIVTTGSPTGIDPSASTWRGCCIQ